MGEKQPFLLAMSLACDLTLGTDINLTTRRRPQEHTDQPTRNTICTNSTPTLAIIPTGAMTRMGTAMDTIIASITHRVQHNLRYVHNDVLLTSVWN